MQEHTFKTDNMECVMIICRFKASQLEVSKKYVLDLKVEICLEPDSCALDVPIFDQVLIPILNCDLTMDFNLKGQCHISVSKQVIGQHSW
jgi:hypothetical protein